MQEIRDEVLEKIKEILDQGSEDIVSYRYTGKKSSTNLTPTDTSPTKTFQPRVNTTRLTEHYLPQNSKSQNFESPLQQDYNYDRHIIGIGDYGNL